MTRPAIDLDQARRYIAAICHGASPCIQVFDDTPEKAKDKAGHRTAPWSDLETWATACNDAACGVNAVDFAF